MTKTWLRIIFTLAVLGSCGPTLIARAQDDAQATQAARSLFEEGVALADRGDLAGAETRFRRALALRESPVIAFNLASVLLQRGAHVEAATIARGVADNPDAPAELRESARQLLADARPSVAELTLRTQGTAEECRVTLDQQDVSADELAGPLFVEPGAHAIEAHVGDRIADSEQVTLGAGESREVVLDLQAVPSPEEVATLAAAESQGSELTRTDSGPAVTETWWFWTGVGAATVGAVVVGVLLTSSGSGSGGGPEQGRFAGDFVPGSLSVEVAR